MKKTYCAGEYYNFTVTGISNNRIYLKDDQGDTSLSTPSTSRPSGTGPHPKYQPTS